MRTIRITHEALESLLTKAYEEHTGTKLADNEVVDIVYSIEGIDEAIEERIEAIINIKTVDAGLFA